MRVAHLGHSTAAGGAELALRRMLEARAPGAWDGVVVLPRGDDAGAFAGLTAAPLVRCGPAQPAGVGARAGVLGAAQGVAALLRAAAAVRAATRRADVVHANTSRSAVYGALAVRRGQVLVVHLRDRLTPEALGGHGFAALRLALRRADGVVANSGSTLATAAPHLRDGAATLVLPSPLGLDGARGRPPAVPVGAPRVVGMVARMSHWKGQELLVEAFAKAYAGTAVRLRLVGGVQFGDDDVVERVRALAASLGVATQLELPGHVDDVAREIAGLDVCVQASTLPEPLGQNVLQYLALGRPTVVADAGGPAEWVRDGENGLVFATGDATSLADALLRLADPALRSRLADGALRTAVPTDAEVAHRFAEFLRSVPGAVPGPRQASRVSTASSAARVARQSWASAQARARRRASASA